MKLIELLARELKEWPDDGITQYVSQDGSRRVYGWDILPVCDGGGEWVSGDAGSGVTWGFNNQKWELSDDYATAIVTREMWEVATGRFIPTATTPTLETMLTEWRDLEARAQAAQAEADALFEHAGQCHGEITTRLAELGWDTPRMVPGEPVVTLDTPVNVGHYRKLLPGDVIEAVEDGEWLQSWIGKHLTVVEIDHNDISLPIYATLGLGDDGSDWGRAYKFISRPSTQP